MPGRERAVRGERGTRSSPSDGAAALDRPTAVWPARKAHDVGKKVRILYFIQPDTYDRAFRSGCTPCRI